MPWEAWECRHLCEGLILLPWSTHQGRIARACGVSSINSLRTIHAVSQHSCTVVFPPAVHNVPISLPSHQRILLCYLLEMAVLADVVSVSLWFSWTFPRNQECQDLFTYLLALHMCSGNKSGNRSISFCWKIRVFGSFFVFVCLFFAMVFFLRCSFPVLGVFICVALSHLPSKSASYCHGLLCICKFTYCCPYKHGWMSSSVSAPRKRVTLFPPATSHINFIWFLGDGGWHGPFSQDEMLPGPVLRRSPAGRHSFVSSQLHQPCRI